MKKSIISLTILLIVALCLSCSNSTSPEETPPLGDFLYGNYVDVHAHWSQNYSGAGGDTIHSASSTDSTRLTLSSNGAYTMRLELYVKLLDTVFNIYQAGNYITKETQYVRSDHVLGSSYWEGTIVFTPEGGTLWEARFWIPSSTLDLFFDNYWQVKFELSDSTGWFIVRNWYRKKKL